MVDHAVAFGIEVLSCEPVKLLEPIEVPPAAPELTICDHGEAVLNFFGNQIRDRGVLNPAELREGNFSSVVLGSGFLDFLRAQEGTNDIEFSIQHGTRLPRDGV